MNKPNRVHKATGWLAKLDNNPQAGNPQAVNMYRLYDPIIGETTCTLPAEIVEGEGWEEEKSEIDELMLEVECTLDDNCYDIDLCKDVIKNKILEFAKNYKG